MPDTEGKDSKKEGKGLEAPICPKCKAEMYERGTRIFPERIFIMSGRYGEMLSERPERGEIVFSCLKCNTHSSIPIRISIDRVTEAD